MSEQTFRIVQVSDTHLSRSHAYFQDNWEAALTYLRAAPPDLVVHSGDVAFNAPDVPDDLAFAREQLDRLGVPWLALPGNHDVGEPGEAPRLGQPIGTDSLALWTQAFGRDRFCRDLGQWRFIGLNSELLGSGLPQETAQWQFLSDCLAGAGERTLGVFLHKPLWIGDPEDTRLTGGCVHPAPRARLLAALRGAGVRFVTSGHLHTYHHSTHAGVDLVWCPTTAFVDPAREWPVTVVIRAGLLEWCFDGSQVVHRLVEPALMQNIDISNWMREVGSTISLPPLAQRPAPR